MRISDWSSDVCSSDLIVRPLSASLARPARGAARATGGADRQGGAGAQRAAARIGARGFPGQGRHRSAKRRDGKEGVSTCTYLWSPAHYKKKTNHKTVSRRIHA